ncbi:uncharacterized protein LOC131435983 [Malaya genurostris]|uniref:uncharacterized protein LOC131435983 n=1 Tax=Malaya genurostris TaxID=325434 RepID=UPI0026F4066A|nr:uncharacterized protein LOC131435983 [Malaya genurostris]
MLGGFYELGAAGLAPNLMRMYGAAGLSPNVAFFRGSTLGDQIRGLPIQKCFTMTPNYIYRLSEHAVCALTNCYVTNVLPADFRPRAVELRALKMAAYTLRWLHQEPENEPVSAAVYHNVNEVLSRAPPLIAVYQAANLAWNQRYHAIRPMVNARQPMRHSYHAAMLHYACPEMYKETTTERLQIDCDFTDPHDLVVFPDYDLQPLNDEAYAERWRILPFEMKLRFFEFLAAFATNICLRDMYEAFVAVLIAICKEGTVDEFKLHSLLTNKLDYSSIALQPRVINSELIEILWTQFIHNRRITAFQQYNLFMAVYHHSRFYFGEPIVRMVEQMSLVHATPVFIIASAGAELHVKLMYFLQCDVTPNDVTQFARACCYQLRNKLAAIINPPVAASEFGELLELAKAIVEHRSMTDYQRRAVRGWTGADIRRSAIAQAILRAQTRMATVMTSSEVQIRRNYGLNVEMVAPDRYVVVASGDKANAPQAIQRGRSPEEILDSMPALPIDTAFATLCSAIIATKRQTQWPVQELGKPYPSPNRPLPRAIVEAARVLGFEWVEPVDDYVPPAIPALPPWDVGCLGHLPIPRTGIFANDPCGPEDADRRDRPFRDNPNAVEEAYLRGQPPRDPDNRRPPRPQGSAPEEQMDKPRSPDELPPAPFASGSGLVQPLLDIPHAQESKPRKKKGTTAPIRA